MMKLAQAVQTVIRVLAVLAILEGPAYAQVCPAVGADTTCGVIITVTKTSNSPCPSQGCASVSFTGQGPYDSIEDTLVGFVNNGNLPISSLVLKSSTTAFGFDGDGICGLDPNTNQPFNPAPPACSFGPTGYEGPGVSFSNISPDATTGTVNFSPPIPPGGTAYFSLEESLTQATACSSVINGSVPKPAGGGTTISAVFTPNLGYTLAQAAKICGFVDWNWQQTITNLPLPNVFRARSNPTTPLSAPPPFNDPPAGGGYTYSPAPDNSYPFYLDRSNGELAGQQTSNTLSFSDTPADFCLPGTQSAAVAAKADANCGGKGKRAPAGSYIAFTTHLAGVNADGTATDVGIGFSWKSTFNGTSGGISVTKNSLPVDPGSGTGSITITAFNGNTSYQYPKGLGVMAINGVATNPASSATSTLLGGGQVLVKASGLAYSRVTRTFNGTVNITNVSNGTIAGPFQIVLDSLTGGVTLANASGSFGGWSYITVPSAGSLAPGQSATVNVNFQNPSNVAINFLPVPYSGSFN